jgi:hypothetical protein
LVERNFMTIFGKFTRDKPPIVRSRQRGGNSSAIFAIEQPRPGNPDHRSPAWRYPHAVALGGIAHRHPTPVGLSLARIEMRVAVLEQLFGCQRPPIADQGSPNAALVPANTVWRRISV